MEGDVLKTHPVTGHMVVMCLLGRGSFKAFRRRRLVMEGGPLRSEPHGLGLIPGTQKGERTELIPRVCPVTSTCTLWDMHAHVYVHTHDENK